MPIQLRRKLRVVLAGGGTGGHMFPLLAVADYLRGAEEGGNLMLAYVGSVGRFRQEFLLRQIPVAAIFGAKLRRYFDVRNALDVPLFCISLLQALFHLFFIMPDAVFSKGGPGAFAVVLAARFYRIPVVVHESDAIPSLTTKLSMRFAKRVGVSFPQTAEFVPKTKVFVSGNPVRRELLQEVFDSAGLKQHFGFVREVPMVLVLGGSQGAQALNAFVFDNLWELVGEVQVCHQVGATNVREAREFVKIALGKLPREMQQRYYFRDFFDAREMHLALAAADVVLSRAGSSIFEIAVAGKPSILVPLKSAANDHQQANAYSYANTGAALVLEEENLQPHLVLGEVQKIVSDAARLRRMSEAAQAFARPDAAEVVGREVLGVAGLVM